MLQENWESRVYLGAARAICGALLRLIYQGPVGVSPVTNLSVERLRAGFMDIIEDCAVTIEAKSHSRLRYQVRQLTYRK